MRKLILFTGIFLTGIISLNAQDITEAQISKEVNHLNKVCELSPKQEEDVRPIVEEYLKARKANELRCGNDTKELNKANKAAKEDYLVKLRGVLASNQFEKLKPKPKTYHKLSSGKVSQRKASNEKKPRTRENAGKTSHHSTSTERKSHTTANGEKKPRKRKKKDE